MNEEKLSVAIVGCGRMGQHYARAYATFPDTRLLALVDPNEARLRAAGALFGVAHLFADVQGLLASALPDLVAVVAPVKYQKDAVIACARAGVRGVSVEKPIAARLSDADEMVEACRERGAIFAGGNLQRAMPEVQEVARRLRSGQYGTLQGASVHGFGGEISGGGCQHLSVLRLLADAEVEQVVAWGSPPERLQQESDEGLFINGCFRLSNGVHCPVFGQPTPCRGVDVWTGEALLRWDWAPPQIFLGGDAAGRRPIDPGYSPYPWREFGYLGGSIRSFIDAVRTGSRPWISGEDLRQALEVAIACKRSALLESLPVSLPLEDRSLSLLPTPYRWLGGDRTGRPQPVEEVGRS